MRYLFALLLTALLFADLANNKLQAQLFEKLRDRFLERHTPSTAERVFSRVYFSLMGMSYTYLLRRGRQWFFLNRDFPVFQTQTVLDREQIRTEVAKLTGLV